ncbi:MAG: hypothetical protein A2675_04250 [Candidatus Yonathbacteria bacterium RIFCSPHIGHO2_01_FULL_51_10]|uniref:Uncharacterized protein n=1 Tax=Candidatus Yonathbacteria bacterium RIFCSPHIGHO2_01_FULL_51_10 TaxID=1802723 RepID=A0A1G2S6X6_9BACT|nr:MAG: hypothetical protein A2675_04250 [Candidatus Yonathbacteria bacterium RIFCSPHIGHO2_01_FULL_51_10]
MEKDKALLVIEGRLSITSRELIELHMIFSRLGDLHVHVIEPHQLIKFRIEETCFLLRDVDLIKTATVVHEPWPCEHKQKHGHKGSLRSRIVKHEGVFSKNRSRTLLHRSGVRSSKWR